MYEVGMIKRIIAIVFCLIVIGVSDTALADDAPLHVVWDRKPINIVLPVGQERMISFPGQVKFGYDADKLVSQILHIQNNGHTLYFLAKKAFLPQRVEVLLPAAGKIILLNLSAKRSAPTVPLDVVLKQSPSNAPLVDNKQNRKININYVTLARFATQQLYAPKRLLKKI